MAKYSVYMNFEEDDKKEMDKAEAMAKGCGCIDEEIECDLTSYQCNKEYKPIYYVEFFFNSIGDVRKFKNLIYTPPKEE